MHLKNLLLCFTTWLLFSLQIARCSIPTLLIKMTITSGSEQFFISLDLLYDNLSGDIPYHFLISCDINDASMNNETSINRLQQYAHLSFYFGDYLSSIKAYNSDIEKHPDFDMILLASDDMQVVAHHYDKIIFSTMMMHFPNLDGVVYFNDGRTGTSLSGIPVIGKEYYNRFGYIYHPSYTSFFGIDELAAVSRILKKERTSSNIIIKYNESINNQTMNNTQWQTDFENFKQRRINIFFLDPYFIKAACPKDWSILICTLEKRKNSFEFIYNKLKHQIEQLGLEDKVEILFFSDAGQNTVGFKRNKLLQQSRGAYVSFMDDDDDVHDNYIAMIHEKLQKNPDCVSLMGIITTNGKNPKKFIHSINFRSWFDKDQIYYRPPNHLNPMKRSIAVQFLFPERNFGEDHVWSKEVTKSELLQHEEWVNTPYYFYLYVNGKKNIFARTQTCVNKHTYYRVDTSDMPRFDTMF